MYRKAGHPNAKLIASLGLAQEEAEEAREAGGNMTEAHGKAAVNNMRLDAGRVEDPDTQEDRRPAYSPFRQWPPDRCATALSIPKVGHFGTGVHKSAP